MDIMEETTTPATVCIHVCLPSSTLDHAMAGVKRKSNQRKERCGKRYIRVKKRSVENIMCPLIFQKRVIIVNTEDITKAAVVTAVISGFLIKRVLATDSRRNIVACRVK